MRLDKPPCTRAPVRESVFCFKKYCLFCGNEADEDNEKKKAQNVRKKSIKLLHFHSNNLL